MTTVKVEARGWIFLHHPPSTSRLISLDPIPSTCLLLLQPSPHFLWLVTRKPFWAPRLQPLANTSIDHLLTNDWKLDWKHISHLRINVWTLWVTKFLGCQLLYTASSPWTNIDVKRNPTSYKPHTSWILYTCISDQWQLWILHWSSFYRWALPPPLQLVSVGLKVDNFQ